MQVMTPCHNPVFYLIAGDDSLVDAGHDALRRLVSYLIAGDDFLVNAGHDALPQPRVLPYSRWW